MLLTINRLSSFLQNNTPKWTNTWWNLADSGWMPSISLVTVWALNKDGTVT